MNKKMIVLMAGLMTMLTATAGGYTRCPPHYPQPARHLHRCGNDSRNFWTSMAGAAVGTVVANALTAPRTTTVVAQQPVVTTVAQPAYTQVVQPNYTTTVPVATGVACQTGQPVAFDNYGQPCQTYPAGPTFVAPVNHTARQWVNDQYVTQQLPNGQVVQMKIPGHYECQTTVYQ